MAEALPLQFRVKRIPLIRLPPAARWFVPAPATVGSPPPPPSPQSQGRLQVPRSYFCLQSSANLYFVRTRNMAAARRFDPGDTVVTTQRSRASCIHVQMRRIKDRNSVGSALLLRPSGFYCLTRGRKGMTILKSCLWRRGKRKTEASLTLSGAFARRCDLRVTCHVILSSVFIQNHPPPRGGFLEESRRKRLGD